MKRISTFALVLMIGILGQVHAAPGASSAYITDQQTSYNQDQTTDMFFMVNFVSCLIKGMAPEKRVNQPRYLALVDEKKCDGASDSTGSGGSGSAASAKYPRSVTSVSLNSSNQLVIKAMLKAPEDNGAYRHYRILVTVTAGPTVAPPYGAWEMDFCGTPEGSENGECTQRGFIRINSREIATYDIEGTKWFSKGRVILNNVNSGYGITTGGETRNSNLYESNIDFSFESGRYLRRIKSYQNGALQSNAMSCLNPNITDPDTKFSVWENWLYNASTGDRIKYENQGFQIRNDSGETIGNANYWGVNFWDQSSSADRQDGATVRGLYNGADTVFTLNKSPGRLEKVTVSGSTLSSVDGISFKMDFWGKTKEVLQYAYSNNSDALAEINAVSNGWMSAIGAWDNATQAFKISGFQACNPNCNVTALPNASVSYADLTNQNGSLRVDGFGGWIDGAGINYNAGFTAWDSVAQSQQVKAVANVTLLKESRVIVPPPEAPTLLSGSSLVCLGNCYKPSANGLVQAQQVNWPPRIADAVTYTWDANAKAPKASNGAVLNFTDKTTYPNSVWMRLYDAAALQSMACGYWNNNGQYQNSGAYCDWEYTQKLNSVYYNWQSGPNSWDQYIYLTLANSSTPVKFDPPLLLNYVAPAAASLPVGVSPGYAGKEVRIESPSAGEMWLPGSCIDRATRKAAECGENSDWVNDLYIPFSQTLGRVNRVDGTTGLQTSTEYLVKWLNRGVVYAEKNMSECASLNLNTASRLTMPTEAEWKNPALTMPWDATAAEFNANPVVIDGVVQ